MFDILSCDLKTHVQLSEGPEVSVCIESTNSRTQVFLGDAILPNIEQSLVM